MTSCIWTMMWMRSGYLFMLRGFSYCKRVYKASFWKGDVFISSLHLISNSHLKQILEQFRVRCTNLFSTMNTKYKYPPSIQNIYGVKAREQWSSASLFWQRSEAQVLWINLLVFPSDSMHDEINYFLLLLSKCQLMLFLSKNKSLS